MRRPAFGYFSMSRHGEGGSDRDYLAWHQLDHMPEQWRLPGVAWGQRWASTERCRRARAAQEGEWASLGHVVNYLMHDPIEQTLDDFYGLARELRDQGRFPFMLPSLFQGALALTESRAAARVLVSPEVVPFRPHRGIYVIVERPRSGEDWDPDRDDMHSLLVRELVEVAGVAGVWVFTTVDSLRPREILTAGRHRVTMCYLDDEPSDVARRLAAPLERAWASGDAHPLLAAPLESIVDAAWERF